MNDESRKSIDSYDMYKVLLDFPKQIKEAIEIGRNSPVFDEFDNPSKFAVLGMGGSAIGGDLLRSYCLATPGADHLQIHINRCYNLPAFVDNNWHVIASSYSGETEETLSSYAIAKNQTKNIVALCSGGSLQNLAEADGFPVINIPGGMMPRCAIAYSFITMLFQLMRISAFKKQALQSTTESFYEIDEMLTLKSRIYSTISDDNPALSLAKKIHGNALIVYSAPMRTDVINLRWRGQIQENAKNMAFGAIIPEMNHNEINSWDFPIELKQKFMVLLLQDIDDHPRITKRFNAVTEILKEADIDVVSINGDGRSLLTRMLDLIYLADWTSYWLAILNNVDPTPIPVISKLKKYMI